MIWAVAASVFGIAQAAPPAAGAPYGWLGELTGRCYRQVNTNPRWNPNLLDRFCLVQGREELVLWDYNPNPRYTVADLPDRHGRRAGQADAAALRRLRPDRPSTGSGI